MKEKHIQSRGLLGDLRNAGKTSVAVSITILQQKRHEIDLKRK